ncbi:copper amine oxidase [Paenisporosarcina cavernae]|uniref:Copper amine oxidase n=1 Tax=Paenisporosarcina cavernae TaxID=2320858 RepID=A0A385YY94_9BACL|nr:copper amine oxidase [Paenisporosarcina cavernae]AYC30422.1 copper amine oxidase [Paenisporosarcina cavernae]
MNKKTILMSSLSLSLLVPTMVFAEDHNSMGSETNVSSPASELRSALGHLFTEHAFLATEVLKKGADGAEDFDQAAAALSANTDDLTAAISSVYGDDAGAQFKEIWNSHIGYFVDYVTATGAKDEAAKKEALANLDSYRTEQAAFLETATEGRLKAADLEAGLKMHVDQLIWAFDSYVAGDYETSYMNEREAIDHMRMVAASVATAITDQFPDKFENSKAVTPAADLRASLDRVFTEHAGLAVMAMQNGVDGDPDFDASAAALLANADELSAAVASVYGEEGGEAFKEIWKSHIGYFVDYVTATANDDQAGKDAAKKELDGYITDQAAFLATATEDRLPAADLEAGLTEHVDQLLNAFDSYVAGDYETAYSALRESYAHMLMPSEALSGAIVDQFPDKFAGSSMPEGMPKTGMGGTANEDAFPYEWFLLGGLLAASMGGAYSLRRRSNEA